MSLEARTRDVDQFVEEWKDQDDFSERDKLIAEFQTYAADKKAATIRRLQGLQPQESPAVAAGAVVAQQAITDREDEGGLYPDIADTQFLTKLLRKREIRESLQSKLTNRDLQEDSCKTQEFEYTPTQRFVSQFLSPNTPYNGMLLYHGVGVGKTCTAILTAESFLELSPKNKVYILAPPAIQDGFYRTIFDINRVKLGDDADDLNEHEGCTGNRYLELTQTQYEREKKDIEFRVNKLIKKRYSIMGYVAFRNMVRDILDQIPKNLAPERKLVQETRLLQKALSGCLIIVDEAHNLRTVSDEADEEDDSVDDADDEKNDASAGKKLTPFLKRVLNLCEGNKLLLMTATPMYNSYLEIINLLEFLQIVDKVEEDKRIRKSDIQFTETGELTTASEQKIIEISNSRVSYMRGENPKAFPARLDPPEAMRVRTWPSQTPNGSPLTNALEKQNAMRLPLVKCELNGESLMVLQTETDRLIKAKGLGIRTIDSLLQAGNCIFPGATMDSRYGSQGFGNWFAVRGIPGSFESTRLSTLPQYTPANADTEYGWMINSESHLKQYSPKFFNVLQTIQKSEGISFVYSRFVENGAIIFCLLLEANGYTPWGRSAPLFSKGAVSPGGRQCSKCSRKEVGHPSDNHKFSPAFYALLTASDVKTGDKQSLPLSPNNTRVIQVARDPSNVDGGKIKVIVGSQVAGEGLDLKAIRDVHILEGWFHLSKEEQIVGRGIRYCSHQMLKDKRKHNCTIHLYVNTFPAALNKETIDLYSYRKAMNKAVLVGNVSRALKRGAVDCNLNHDIVLISGLSKVKMTTSLNPDREIEVDLNDRDYTPICDWSTCSFECKPSVPVATLSEDTSTYDLFAARFMEHTLIATLKRIFKEQTFYKWEDLATLFSDIPRQTLISLLMRSVDNPSIVLENGQWQGHLVLRNHLFLFQPTSIKDQSIPIALRYGQYPVKRDSYDPIISAPVAAAPVAAKHVVARLPSALAAPVGPVAEDVPAQEVPEFVAQGLAIDQPAPEKAVITQFWTLSNQWIDSWTAPFPETVSPEYDVSILRIAGNDADRRDNIKTRLTKLQWWAKSIHSAGQDASAIADLKKAARQYIWDLFLKPTEQYQLYSEDAPYLEEAIDPEQTVRAGTGPAAITAFRYLDPISHEPVYLCNDAACPPSVLNVFKSSKTDPVVNAVADQTTAGEIYGTLVPWERSYIFKTNAPKPKGKEPGGGAACAIVSTVSGHKKKLVEIGDILARFSEGKRFDLTDEQFKGGRKLQGAPNFCALTEIVLRWMDIRRLRYGGLRFFYRPLSAYYSKHKSKK